MSRSSFRRFLSSRELVGDEFQFARTVTGQFAQLIKAVVYEGLPAENLQGFDERQHMLKAFDSLPVHLSLELFLITHPASEVALKRGGQRY